ncbi:helix-turn-helix transcriptional regulator [Shewanella sp. JM162201]|uniref:Helix-turn-helix transcriptional regulator n=1 Tax=Shewanella jiangmenensis TaxID=2837387 RepID=A0ABS5V3Y7_9GAMM|nr:helix-turn-helix transcriptional regulator [Shewanella jiangmenensis]MBT1444409.1 helix-turn-helix transcriptional regulator [Shewanella jiangmenensis]
MHQEFAKNLRLLCSYYRSVAEVCRRLDINRPQFNRYLSGKYRPSAHSLRRLCDFFGVEEHEILMPHSQFQLLIQVRPRPSEPVSEAPELEHLARLQSLSQGLDKYLGYYFEYHLSMAFPGKILRNLICLEKQGGKVYYQRTERLQQGPGEKVYHSKYFGMAHLLADRIFLMDYESLTGNQLTQTILIPTFKSRVGRLSGLRLGASASGERIPSCTRVVFEYLGHQVDIRKTLKLCTTLDPDSGQISPRILEAIQNDMAPGERHFRARHSF